MPGSGEKQSGKTWLLLQHPRIAFTKMKAPSKMAGAVLKHVNSPDSRNPQLRYRVFLGKEIALGPGKVQLLQFIRDTGSIRQAAAKMRMSYMRAWSLICTMNRCFRAPLVASTRGGSQRGGAKLTSIGVTVLELYERIEKESLKATEETRRRLLALLKGG